MSNTCCRTLGEQGRRFYAVGTGSPGAGDGGRDTGVMRQLDIFVRGRWRRWRRRRYVYADSNQDLHGEHLVQSHYANSDLGHDGDLAKRGRLWPHNDLQPIESRGLSGMEPVCGFRRVFRCDAHRNLDAGDVPVLLHDPRDTNERRYEGQHHDSVALFVLDQRRLPLCQAGDVSRCPFLFERVLVSSNTSNGGSMRAGLVVLEVVTGVVLLASCSNSTSPIGAGATRGAMRPRSPCRTTLFSRRRTPWRSVRPSLSAGRPIP